MTAFVPWLRKQRNRDDPVGDLANDTCRDTEMPKDVRSYRSFKGYLERIPACSGAIRALERAYAEYCEAHPQTDTGRVITPSLRFEILQRDDFRCQLCGRDAADGVKLEVDHKHPFSLGGATEPDNLWTLCFDCNRGKSTRVLQ